MTQKDIYHNCRNCDNRFSCEEKTETGFCDNYVFDSEAATCDDCSKKDDCPEYKKNRPTCKDWEPIVTCDECTKQGKCKNFAEGGKICKKFEEIRYTLTEKGCLYFAMEDVRNNEKMYVGTQNILGNGFFEELDHEMKINNLVSRHKQTSFRKLLNKIWFRIFKPKKDIRKIFFDVAHKDKYFKDFGLSDEIIGKVVDKFIEILTKHYEV